MPIRELKVRIRVLVEQDESGYFAHCPELQGLAVEAETKEELAANIQCAVQGYIESLIKHNDPLPVGLLESDETHDVLPFIWKKISDRLGISKTSELIQDVRLELPYAPA